MEVIEVLHKDISRQSQCRMELQHKSTNDTTHQHTTAHGSKNIVALALRDTHK